MRLRKIGIAVLTAATLGVGALTATAQSDIQNDRRDIRHDRAAHCTCRCGLMTVYRHEWKRTDHGI